MSNRDCPGCGQPNQCAIEQGKAPETCWCYTKKTPAGFTISAIKPVTEQYPGEKCLCEQCWSKLSAVKN